MAHGDPPGFPLGVKGSYVSRNPRELDPSFYFFKASLALSVKAKAVSFFTSGLASALASIFSLGAGEAAAGACPVGAAAKAGAAVGINPAFSFTFFSICA